MESGIGWAAPGWFLPGGLILALALWLLARGYARSRIQRTVSPVLPALKGAGILLLVLCLAEPMVRGVRVRPGANAFVVLADNSRSMSARDGGDAETRGERMQAALTGESSWQQKIAEDFDLRRYAFDVRLRAVTGFEDLDWSGNQSSLGAALATLAQRFEGTSLAGILLLTDGIATDIAGTDGLGAFPAPVYSVMIGREGEGPDLAMERVIVSPSNFETAPFTLQTHVAHQGYRGRELEVGVFDESGARVDQALVEAGPDGSETVRFELRPPAPGIHFYRVEVREAGSLDTEGEPRREELTADNNGRTVVIDRGGGPYRVLYVCGRPNWEFKFLRRALAEDGDVDLVGLLRIARREPKFDFRSRHGETTNPIFRGFGNQEDEEAEQYDEPVLLRMGTKDEDELRTGFPREAEELFRYDAIILDDVEAAFFTHDQLSLIREFVSRRGGGFLMLGGEESFDRGGYARTPVADVLPVYLDSADTEREGNVRLDITRDGLAQPWVRLRKTESDEQQRLDAMPAFFTVNWTPNVKPGAVVLARARGKGGDPVPALVTQRFGKGRAAAVMVGDVWRWTLRRSETTANDPSLFWRQTVRWLVASVPRRVDIDAESVVGQPGAPMRIAVRIRDGAFEPMDNASVTISVTGPDGKATELVAEASADEAGLYTSQMTPRAPGAYRARVSAVGPDGEVLPGRDTGWVADPSASEFRRLAPDRRLLEQLAEQSGGEIVEAGQLEAFAAGLPTRFAPVTESSSRPLWHRWPVLLAALAFLIGEWGLRRWKGLP